MKDFGDFLHAMFQARAEEAKAKSAGCIYFDNPEDLFEAFQWAIRLEKGTVINPSLDGSNRKPVLFLGFKERGMADIIDAKEVGLLTGKGYIIEAGEISTGAILSAHPKARHGTKADQQFILSQLEGDEE